MRYVQIGETRVSVVGLGAWQFGTEGWGFGNEYNQGDVQRIVDRSLELGVNLFDTAEIYAGGQSETLLGKALGERRKEAFIATKVAPPRLHRKEVLKAAQASLDRLKTDWIDLYQVHWPDAGVKARETMGAMRELQEKGAVRHVGVSNYSLPMWKAAEQALGGPVLTNQVEYSLLERRPERELLSWAQEQGRFVVAYSPIAKGALSGRYTSTTLPGGLRTRERWFRPKVIESMKPLLDALQDIGQRHGATSAQVALAWLLSHPNVLVIPGAKSVEQAEQNAAAADLELNADDLGRLEDASARVAA